MRAKLFGVAAKQRFSISLPPEMAEHIQSKVQSCVYASASEVMRDGVRAHMDRDAALERWLREDVLTGHAEYLADPSKAVPAEEVLGRIKVGRVETK